MKALKIIFILSSLLALTNCGGRKEETDTAFAIQLGNIVSGAALDGGVVLRGSSNNGDDFIYSSANANNVNIPLPPGIWDFQVIGWKLASAPMSGENVCGLEAGVEIDGLNANVSINLSQANCQSLPIADPALSFTATPGQFRNINFNSCMLIAGLGASPGIGATCDDTTLNLKKGFSAFIRVRIPTQGNINLPSGGLLSECMAVAGHNPPTVLNLSGSQFVSSLRLPIKNGSNIPFPVQIISYEKEGCIEEEARYNFPNGFGGNRDGQTASIIYDHDPVTANIAWSDNFIGSADSAFRTGASSAILPFINCFHATNNPGAGYCHNVAVTVALGQEHPRDLVLQGIYDFFGTPNSIEIDDTDPNATASATHIQNTITIQLTATSAGTNGNVSLDFTNDSGIGGVVAVSGNNITYNNDVTGNDLVANINANSNTLGVQAFCSAGPCASDFSGPGATTTVNLTGGTDVLKGNKRSVGAIAEIKELILGPIGGVLFDNGLISLTNVCAAVGNTYAKTINNKGTTEQVAIEIANGAIIPPNYMTTTNGTPLDRRITLSLNGVAEMAFEFNCTGDTGLLWFSELQNDDRLERSETFISHGTAIRAAVEKISYSETNTGAIENKHWAYFQKSSDVIYNYSTIQASPNQNYYARTGALVDMGATKNVKINNYQSNASNSDTHFSGAAPTAPSQSCDYLSGYTGTSTCAGGVATTLNLTTLLGPDGTEQIQGPHLIGAGSFHTDNLDSILDETVFNGF